MAEIAMLIGDNRPTVLGVRFASIADFPGYAVGDDGSMWTCWKRTASLAVLSDEWKKLSPGITESGYPFVRLKWQGSTRQVARRVSRLVLEAFVGPAPDDQAQACHADRTPSNNALTNLRWGTAVENAEDRECHGMTVRGSRVATSKIQEADVLEIRRLRATGMSMRCIGVAFSISRREVGRILRGEYWSQVQEVRCG